MSIAYKNIEVESEHGLVYVRMNRPAVRNAFSQDMIAEMTAAFRGVKADTHLVVLSGNGTVFCAGADLNWMKNMANFSQEENEQDSLLLHELFLSIRECPAPVLGVVQGAAFGGGLGLVAACDLILCEEKTKFCFSEVKIGLAPAVISAFVLEKAALGLAGPWMLSGRVFDAATARRMGLVMEIAEEERLRPLETELIHSMLSAGPEALRATKKLLRDLPEWSRAESRLKTAKLIAERRVSGEGQEGIIGFLEKRDPAWKIKALLNFDYEVSK